jgi:hypothetical protein
MRKSSLAAGTSGAADSLEPLQTWFQSRSNSTSASKPDEVAVGTKAATSAETFQAATGSVSPASSADKVAAARASLPEEWRAQFDLLIQGLSNSEISRILNRERDPSKVIKLTEIEVINSQIYKRFGVKNRYELQRALGVLQESPLQVTPEKLQTDPKPAKKSGSPKPAQQQKAPPKPALVELSENARRIYGVIDGLHPRIRALAEHLIAGSFDPDRVETIMNIDSITLAGLSKSLCNALGLPPSGMSAFIQARDYFRGANIPPRPASSPVSTGSTGTAPAP